MEKKKQFTWEELSSLNEEHNAHVAVRGKVRFSLEIFRGIFDHKLYRGHDHDQWIQSF